jgi:hypothetical protein
MHDLSLLGAGGWPMPSVDEDRRISSATPDSIRFGRLIGLAQDSCVATNYNIFAFNRNQLLKMPRARK